ncbi:MAG: putative nucleotidyltransferase substrate binding domain-containing protein [Thermodesulfobacteriota bacterium]
MAKKEEIPAADPGVVREFLSHTRPFKDLDPSVLTELSERFTQDFYPRGTVILKQAESEVTHFHLVSRGGIRVQHREPDGSVKLIDFLGERGYFGALGIIKQSKANHTVEAAEDTFCYLLDREEFLRLVHTYPMFAKYFLDRFSGDMLGVAYAEMRDRKPFVSGQRGLYLFAAKVGDIVQRPPEMMIGSATVQDAARKMTELSVGSLLVVDEAGTVIGILTDNDLRTKVVSQGLDYATRIDSIASSPVKTIPESALAFDALLQMMNNQVHHLAVERDGQLTGVITAHDIMVQQGTSPISLFREIVAQRHIEGLYPLANKIPLVAATLMQEGGKATDITRMIAVLNDHIVARVLSLLEDELGPAPHQWCWLMLGSEGRREQTFSTDQDNALLYDNLPDEWDRIKTAKLYFRRFGNEAVKHLASCGYALCKGKMMASTPNWRKPYKVWQGYFDRWMASPEPQAVVHASIFFDFRPGYGAYWIGDRLRDHVATAAPRHGIFLMHLAKDCLKGKAPLTFFRDFLVEKDGQHKNRLDLKTRGLVPFVDFGRVMALKYGIRETNTLARFKALADQGYLSSSFHAEIRDAYEFQMQVRLVHQLRRLLAGLPADNYIDPVDLSDTERQTLKEAFGVINSIQTFLRDEIRIVE